MAKEKHQQKDAIQRNTGTQPELSSKDLEDKAKALLDAQKARDERIANFSTAHNSISIDTSFSEEKLESRYSILEEIEEAINEKTQLLKSAGKFTISGRQKNLSGFQKTKLRNQIRNLKTTRTMVNGEVSQLESNLTGYFRKHSNKIIRSNVRRRAKKDSYHNRFGKSIEASINKFIAGFSKEAKSALKTNISKAKNDGGDAIIMQALLKAPRNLHTRVVSNATARKAYLNYFRNQLGGTKGN